MKELPRLNQQELNNWRKEILREDWNKFPNSFLFEQLLYERSALCKIETLHERMRSLLKKFPAQSTIDGLKTIYPDILKYLRGNGFLSDEDYQKEYTKCKSLLL